MTPGRAVKASDAAGSDGVVPSLLDTGAYATAAGHPFGAVGDDPASQSLMEAHRIAEFTVGPWEVDAALRMLPGAMDSGLIGPVSDLQMMRDNHVLPEPLPDIAAAHRFITGFTTVRMTAPESGQQRGLHNVVLQFPDPAAAAAAAGEMAAKAPDPDGTPGRQTPIAGTPEAIAKTYDMPDGTERVESFTAHGPYVLYQSARTAKMFLGATAAPLIQGALNKQKRRIDEFAPTEPAAMPQLPLDPTGQLLARTLWSPDNRSPFIMGVWRPRAWLHFEQDPVASTSLFNTAGVDAVTQRLTTVYQAANADGAARIVDEFSEQMGNIDGVRSVEGVPGFPSARCFERVKGWIPATTPMTWQRVVWHFKCVASVDRYAYTGFSVDLEDVHQQMSAQYRILSDQ
ncbi:hypothetical protein [Mycolicibacterium celeriflavum]|uniref:DUF7373 family lipoprotein n=1 Tax=Mycolicibacterium celeriflavum TaxID=1249101 RepID=UPI000A8DBBAD|nr:hypothetical protein [Mycolicibacterium celeriflavum]